MQRFQIALRLLSDLATTRWDNIDALLEPYFIGIGFEEFLYFHSEAREVLTNWPKSAAQDYITKRCWSERDDPSSQQGAVTAYIWEEAGSIPAGEGSLEFVPPIPAKSGIVLFGVSASRERSVLCLSRRADSQVGYELVPELNMVANALSMKARAAKTTFEASPLDVLSTKQQTILRWIADGKSNFAISMICGLTQRNVDYHVAQILSKLGVSSRAQAAVIFAGFNRQT